MRKVFLFAFATSVLLDLTATSQNMANERAQVAPICEDRSTRIMMICKLMRTKKGKMKIATTLKADAEPWSPRESMAANPG